MSSHKTHKGECLHRINVTKSIAPCNWGASRFNCKHLQILYKVKNQLWSNNIWLSKAKHLKIPPAYIYIWSSLMLRCLWTTDPECVIHNVKTRNSRFHYCAECVFFKSPLFPWQCLTQRKEKGCFKNIIFRHLMENKTKFRKYFSLHRTFLGNFKPYCYTITERSTCFSAILAESRCNVCVHTWHLTCETMYT